MLSIGQLYGVGMRGCVALGRIFIIFCKDYTVFLLFLKNFILI